MSKLQTLFDDYMSVRAEFIKARTALAEINAQLDEAVEAYTTLWDEAETMTKRVASAFIGTTLPIDREFARTYGTLLEHLADAKLSMDELKTAVERGNRAQVQRQKLLVERARDLPKILHSDLSGVLGSAPPKDEIADAAVAP
jgi:chromosome segregation ATPase